MVLLGYLAAIKLRETFNLDYPLLDDDFELDR